MNNSNIFTTAVQPANTQVDSKNIKVLFVTIGGNYITKCKFRIYNYFPTWHEYGIDAFDIGWKLKADAQTKKKIADQIVEAAKYHDITYLYRVYLDNDLIQRIRKSAKILVWDYDDAVYYVPSGQASPAFPGSKTNIEKLKRVYRTIVRGNPYYSERKKILDYTLRHCDGVVAGNSNLANYALQYAKSAVIAPTPINVKTIPVKNHENTEPVVIGWTGKPENLNYIEYYHKSFNQVGKKYHKKTILKIVSQSKPIMLTHIPVDFKKWTPENDISVLNTFDIGIMPLTDDGWARGKCGFKALLCMGAGLPAVVSPVGINADLVKDGINGFHASNENEWVEKLSLLIDDWELRKELGKNARKTVEEEYSTEVIQSRIARYLRGLTRNR